MEYVLLIHRAEDGHYRAEVPALSGCFLQAETLDGLLADAPRTISSYLEALAESGRKAPTDQGIIVATVTLSESPVRVVETGQAPDYLRGERDPYPVSLEAVALGKGNVPGGKKIAEGETVPRERGSLPGWVTRNARIAGAVLVLWIVLVSVSPLWDAWDSLTGTRQPRSGVPAADVQNGPRTDPTVGAPEPTILPVAAAALPPTATPGVALLVTPTTSAPAPAPTGQDGYVVKPGETLWAISQKFGLTVEEVMRANGLTDRTFVRSGQRLVIPEPRR